MIINPIWFYLMGVSEYLGMFLIVFGVISLISGFTVALVASILEFKIDGIFKKFFIIGGIVTFLGCLMPSKETCYQMLIASVITKDNIEFTVETSKEVVDYIIEKVDEFDNEQEGD